MPDEELEKIAKLLKDPSTYTLGMQLWHDLHFDYLIRKAHLLLSPKYRRIISAEELVSSTMGRFHAALTAGRYQTCSGAELRNLLNGILKNRAREFYEKQNTAKRNSQAVEFTETSQLEAARPKPPPETPLRVRDEHGNDPEPTPKQQPNPPLTVEQLHHELVGQLSAEQAVLLKESLEKLGSPHAEVALLIVQGYSQTSIATRLNKATREVSRIYRQAFAMLQAELEQASAIEQALSSMAQRNV
jgi:DNA-directed RNA polymerase specialized sigma24 family protein